MKTRSAKNKGARLQDLVATRLATKLINLEFGTDKDLKGRTMGNKGVDVVMSAKAKLQIPFDIECKNQETWSVAKWWEQTLSNVKEGRKPLLVIKKNNHEPLAILRLEDLIDILKESNDAKILGISQDKV